MNNKLIGILIWMLLIGTILSVSGNIDVSSTFMLLSSGNTLYVGGSGPGNYSTIQDAIDDSEDGDIVFVYNGTYYENDITIYTSIFLIGEDKIHTIIDANGSGAGIVVYANGVTIRGFTIQHAEFPYGVGINLFSDNNIVTDNIIANNGGIGLDIFGMHNNISYNIISNNRWNGIDCDYSKHIIIGNEIVSSSNGIEIWFGSSTVISNNNISDNIIGISLVWATNISVIKNNFINNNISAIFSRSILGELRNKLLEEFWHWFLPDESYDPYYKPLKKNIWDGNYWDKPRTIPKPIFGCIRLFGRFLYIEEIPFPINFVNFDKNPAQEPYDVSVC